MMSNFKTLQSTILVQRIFIAGAMPSILVSALLFLGGLLIFLNVLIFPSHESGGLCAVCGGGFSNALAMASAGILVIVGAGLAGLLILSRSLRRILAIIGIIANLLTSAIGLFWGLSLIYNFKDINLFIFIVPDGILILCCASAGLSALICWHNLGFPPTRTLLGKRRAR